METVQHSIRVASKKSGLTPHVIRVWERRYGAVEPVRTGTNRRLYTDRDIERLSLLKKLTGAGHSISHVASLSTDQLRAMVEEHLAELTAEAISPPASQGLRAEQLLNECLDATRRMDSLRLDQLLERGAVEFGGQGLLRHVIAPLTHRIGELWYLGEITAAHEHFASSIVRVFLGGITKPFALSSQSPCLVVATPVGQVHELGAVMVGAAASHAGWRVTYLGASLPAAEIAGAVRSNQAKALALSLVFPENDPQVGEELAALRRYLPKDFPILVGGRAAKSYHEAIENVSGVMLLDLEDCCDYLRDLVSAK